MTIINSDVFKQINNAVLDLQRAQLQSYERPIRVLGRLLKHPDFDDANKELTTDLDLDAFLVESRRSQGGMVGSAKLAWPDDHLKSLGLMLILILRFAAKPDDMISIGHTYFYSGSSAISGIHGITRDIIIPFVRDYKSFVEKRGILPVAITPSASKKIFIVHGHDGGAREAVARFLQNIGFEPVILHEQANLGRTVIEKVEANSDVSFAVVLLTPDDEGCVKGGTLEPRARQNVLLELGYFMGRLGRQRVCALKRGDVEIPSDFAGVVWAVMDDGLGWKQALGKELKAVGHDIDWNMVMR